MECFPSRIVNLQRIFDTSSFTVCKFKELLGIPNFLWESSLQASTSFQFLKYHQHHQKQENVKTYASILLS